MPVKNELDYSMPFKRGLKSDDPRVIELVNKVNDALFAKGLVVSSPNTFKLVLMKVILNLLAAYKNDPKLYVSVSRDRNRYKKGARHKSQHIVYEYIIEVLDSMKDFGFIDHPTGFYDEDNSSRMSRIKAKPKLIKLFDKYQLSITMVKHDPNREIIVLKDSDGEVIPYQETVTTRLYRSSLIPINIRLEIADLDLPIPDVMHSELLRHLAKGNKDKRRRKPKSKKNKTKPNPHPIVTVDFTQKQLKRVFIEGDFELGGRFYGGWWIGIPSKYRKYIRIDGRSTVELDYSQMHPTILYAMVDEVLIGDPYMLEGFDKKHRNKLKVVWNTMVNSPNAGVAKKSLQYDMPKASLPDGYDDLDDVFEAFQKKQVVISGYFFSDYGKKLQYFDSAIAECVMTVLLACDAVCLPVHDSFIVDYRHEELLCHVMEWAFRVHVGVQPKIKKDKTIFDVKKTIDQLPSPEDMVALIEQVKIEGETGKDPFSRFHKRRADKDNATTNIEPESGAIDIFIL
jgi:hypothetical protein